MGVYDFDLFVIGGGSGGVRAARVAAGLGKRVGLAEESRMGGTCVIRGCVPKKLMVFASGYRESVAHAKSYGWEAEIGDFHWPQFRSKLHAELARLESVYHRLLDNAGVEKFEQRARISGANEVTLADGTQITAAIILIATGGRPVRPSLPNSDLGLVSDDIFDLDTLPRSILIVGGGYIASEFACILNGLGVSVTQFYRGSQILRGFDDEARGMVSAAMIARGIDLRLGVNVEELKPHPKGISVAATDGGTYQFDQVFFATGRAPNTRDLGLDQVGVTVAKDGAVTVDSLSRTNIPSIYAIGDVTNRVQLTPVAIREAMAFVETVFKDNPTAPDHTTVPSAVFTQPELGTVGLSEEEARARGPIEVYSAAFSPMRTAFAGCDSKVLMKLVVDKQTRVVLGCHIVAEAAGELIQLAGVAIKMGATKEDFDRTVAVHPTMAEELVTMSQPTRTT